MTQPSDYSERRRFAEEIERNFSVKAAAGSGKTHAITERIVQIARSPRAAEILPRLVVVTFTHRAADEMQQRTRQRILEEVHVPLIHAAFNRAFFGTIHSFCMKLLANFGHYLGLPPTLDLVTDDEELWAEFVQQHLHVGRNLSGDNRRQLFRLAQARQLMELGRNARTSLALGGDILAWPQPNFDEVFTVEGKGKSLETIAASKAELGEFDQRLKENWDFVRWPARSSSAKEFLKLWTEALRPLREWVANCASSVAAEVQRDYRDFRLARGVVTYADQVALADELLQHPLAGPRIREEDFRVILDEAQDTDPTQFSVLLGVANPPEVVAGVVDPGFAERGYAPDQPGSTIPATTPRPGHFCMVGDFQQSIYHDRADLQHYEAVHQALVRQDRGAELKFSVTFRLDQEQLNFVNQTFREILNQKDGQVEFIELQPRPEILPGQVVRVSLGKELLPAAKLKDYRKAKHAAVALAAWIQKTGCKKLRANDWRDVAILCPRKAWLRTIAVELRKLGLPVAIQSESDLKGDHPAHAWLTALCTIMADPRNSYEIVGVLREVFGISDQDLALFSEGQGTRFRIDEPAMIAGVVSTPLKLLAETRLEMQNRALFDAVSILLARTQLRERLATLPVEDFPNSASDLDALLAIAAQAEADGATLEDFAAKLRADFLTPRDVRLSSENGLQLITAQKAKGSEWQAVILPFLGRNVIPPSPRYPTLLKIPGESEPIVALNKEDFQEENRAIVKLANRQEAARLLYVAATRARHTLVLVDDSEIFVNSQNALPTNAQLRHFGEKQAEIFTAVSTEARSCAATVRGVSHRAERETSVALPPLEKREREKALKRAQSFIRKINPSAYEPEIELEEAEGGRIQLRSLTDNFATLHGRWWHHFFQRVHWRDGLAGADRLFQELHANAPDPARVGAEWKRARENLFASTIAKRFIARGAQTRAEFPFSWKMNNSSALEGVIDFLLLEAKAQRGLLVDWKTNNITPGDAEVLRARYRPQLAAYWKAAGEITGLKVEAALFSTALGKFLPYSSEELDNEWSRLEQLPPQRLDHEVHPDAE